MKDRSDSLLSPWDAMPLELQGSHGLTTERPIRQLRHVWFGGGGKSDNRIPETPEQRELAKIAMEKLALYEQKLAPLEQAYIHKVHEQKTEGARKFARGAAAQSTQAAFSPVKRQAASAEFSRGVNPNSGRFKHSLSDINIDTGKAVGENAAQAGVAQEDEYVQGLTNIAAIGQGKSASAQAGLGGIAELSQRKAESDAISAWEKKQNRLGTTGSAAGAGIYLASKKQPEQPGLSWSGADPQFKEEETALYRMFNP